MRDPFNITPLRKLVERVTGKRVEFAGMWCQDFDLIQVEDDQDVEGLLHELGHWVVATNREREWPNLMLDEWDDCASHIPRWAGGHIPDFRERRNFCSGRVNQREMQTVHFEVRCLQEAGLADPYEWLLTYSEGSSPLYYRKSIREERRGLDKRLSKHLVALGLGGIRGFLPRVSEALRACSDTPFEGQE